MGKKARKPPEINASSMADIAFLLLIFFLVTTTIASDKGLAVQLPPKQDKPQDVEVKQRNVYNILLNSKDQMLLEGEYGDIKQLKDKIKEHIKNNGVNPNLSETPKDAIVSIKADRGTNYGIYIIVLDEVKKAYSELRAEILGITVDQYLEVQLKKTPEHKEMMDKAQEAYPYQVSDAEPTSVGK